MVFLTESLVAEMTLKGFDPSVDHHVTFQRSPLLERLKTFRAPRSRRISIVLRRFTVRLLCFIFRLCFVFQGLVPSVIFRVFLASLHWGPYNYQNCKLIGKLSGNLLNIYLLTYDGLYLIYLSEQI